MAGQAYVSFPIPHDTGALARLRLALVVSASSHLLLAQALAPDAPPRHPQAASALPMKVWIEPLPVTRAVSPATVEAEAPLEPGRVERPAAVADAGLAGLPRVVPVTSPLALPQLPDLTVYTARDLDSYPQPVAPLDTGRIEDPVAGKPVSVRLELVIDERGVVNEVAVAGPGPAGFAEAELRALLAATRFIPARKNGRAVKSRVLLSFSLVAKAGTR
jgi:protein TonB